MRSVHPLPGQIKAKARAEFWIYSPFKTVHGFLANLFRSNNIQILMNIFTCNLPGFIFAIKHFVTIESGSELNLFICVK